MNQDSKKKRKQEKNTLQIGDEANTPEIMDEELDRVSGGGNNSVWGTKQEGGPGSSPGP
jgi:hypothetical protein